MDYLKLLKRTLGTGVLCTLVYNGTLLMLGQTVTLKSATTFFVVFIVLYYLWLFLTSIGKKK